MTIKRNSPNFCVVTTRAQFVEHKKNIQKMYSNYITNLSCSINVLQFLWSIFVVTSSICLPLINQAAFNVYFNAYLYFQIEKPKVKTT